VWGTARSVALSLRIAMLPLTSQVSIARTIIYEQFYHSTKVRGFRFEALAAAKSQLKHMI